MESRTDAVRVPPYIAFKTLKTLLEDLKANGIPTEIDRSVWGSHVSGSVGVQLMSALRFLRMIDADNHPEQALADLVAALDTDRWRATLRGLIERVYEPVMGLNLSSMTYQHLFEAFRNQYKAQDTVLGKSVRFFIQAVQEAGIPLSPRIEKGTRPRRPRGGRQGSFKKGDRMNDRDEGDVDRQPPLPPPAPLSLTQSRIQALIDILDPESMEDDEQSAVWTLIRYLKKTDRGE